MPTAWLDESFSLRLATALLHFVWQGAAVAVLAVVLGWMLRSSTASLRYLMYVAAMLVMAACLPVTFCCLGIPASAKKMSHTTFLTVGETSPPDAESMDVEDVSGGSAANLRDREPVNGTGGAGLAGRKAPSGHFPFGRNPGPTHNRDDARPGSMPTRAETDVLASSGRWLRAMAPYLTTLYLAGVVWMLARLTIALRGGHRLRRSTMPITNEDMSALIERQAARLGMRKCPTFAWSAEISIPVVVGILRPIILLPAMSATGLSTRQLEALITHELAHICRYDTLVNLLQRCIEAVLFFHPAVWILSRRVEWERENAADDMVLAAGWQRPAYADALVRMAELASTERKRRVTQQPTLVAASGRSASELKRRVLRLLQPTHPPRLRLTRSGLVAALLLTASLLTLPWLTRNAAEGNAKEPGKGAPTGDPPAAATTAGSKKKEAPPTGKNASIELGKTKPRRTGSVREDEQGALARAQALRKSASRNPTLLQGTRLSSQNQMGWKWLVYLPPGKKWKLKGAVGRIPEWGRRAYEMDDARVSTFDILRDESNGGVMLLEGHIHRPFEGHWTLMVEGSKSSLPGSGHAVWSMQGKAVEVAEYITGHRKAKSWTHRGDLEVGRTSTKINRRLELTRWTYEPSNEPANRKRRPGFAIWIEEEKTEAAERPKTATGRIAWGRQVNGAQAGIETPQGTYRIGDDVPLRFLVRNNSSKTIELMYPRVPVFINWNNYRRKPGPQLLGPDGKQIFPVRGVGGRGLPDLYKKKIAAGETLVMASTFLPLRSKDWKGQTINLLTYSVSPGRHRLSLSYRFGGSEEERLWHGELVSGTLQLDVKAAAGKESAASLAGAWGKSQGGVRCRLRVDKPGWLVGETPILLADLQNRGKRAIGESWHSMEFKLQVDGKWTERIFPKTVDGPVQPLSPGSEWINVPLVLGSHFGTRNGPPDLSRLSLPGKHKLRIEVEGVKSNEIEITVAAPSPTKDGRKKSDRKEGDRKKGDAIDQPNKQAANKDRTIECRVSGDQGALPGAKATVTLTIASGPDARGRGPAEIVEKTIQTTDAAGKYQIRIPEEFLDNPDVRITVVVAHPLYMERTMGPLPVSALLGKKRLAVIPQMAKQAMQATRLRKVRVIRGRILLPNGRPAVGAKVETRTKYRAYSWKFFSPHDYSFSDSAVTDAAGRFSVRADRRITLTAFKPGEAPLVLDDFDKRIAIAKGDPPGTLRLPNAIIMRGRVLDHAGAPVPRALVAARRDFAWNESDMPLSFGRMCVADEQGNYVLPRLPAGRYKLTVAARLMAGSDLAAYNKQAAGTLQATPPFVAGPKVAKFKSEPLSLIFLPVIAAIGDNVLAVRDLRSVPMIPIRAKVLFPDGAPDSKRRSDVGISGRINGRKWQGRYVKAGRDGFATLLAPKGLGPFIIKTGTAFHRRGDRSELEIGQAIHFRDLEQDLREITVVKRRLATLEVKLSLPAELKREYRRSKAFVSIQASYVRKGFREQSAKKQTIGLTGSAQRGASAYRARALPGEPIRLAVVVRRGGETRLLHERRLTLKPGEVRVEQVKIGKP